MSDEDIVEISTLLHRQWTEAERVVEDLKQARPDGTPDWRAFHDQRCEAALEQARRWNGLLCRYMDEHRHVITRAFGL